MKIDWVGYWLLVLFLSQVGLLPTLVQLLSGAEFSSFTSHRSKFILKQRLNLRLDSLKSKILKLRPSLKEQYSESMAS